MNENKTISGRNIYGRLWLKRTVFLVVMTMLLTDDDKYISRKHSNDGFRGEQPTVWFSITVFF
jgi:hypothetical protein